MKILSPKNFKINAIILILALITVSVILVFLLSKDKNNSSIKEIQLSSLHQDKKRGFAIGYPDIFKKQQISKQDEDEVSLILKSPDPELQIMVWRESGLALLEKFSDKTLIDQLRVNVDRLYSNAYPEFTKEKIEDYEMGNEKGFVVQFTFLRPKSSERERIFMAITSKSGNAYYAQCLALVPDWSKVEAICKEVIKSFRFIDL